MKKFLITLATTLGALAIVTTSAYALGTLTPSGTAGDDTQYSLNDIYNKLTDFSNTYSEDSGTISVPGSITASFYTLSDIYGLLEDEEDDLTAENIADGVEIFGVEGTLEGATTLEWSTEKDYEVWADAVSVCANLTEGGATAGDWRLPKISELIDGIEDDWVVEGDNEGDIFNGSSYWSITEKNSSNVYVADWDGIYGDDLYIGNNLKNGSPNIFRCVR